MNLIGIALEMKKQLCEITVEWRRVPEYRFYFFSFCRAR
jgi:hypothetical protein